MYKVISKEKEQSFRSLELAMEHAKLMNEFVTIKSNDFVVCSVLILLRMASVQMV